MAKTMTKKPTASAKPPTKSQLYSEIAEKTDLSRKEVSAVFEQLDEIAKRSLKKHDAFTIPGMAKLVIQKKKAVKEHERPDPFNKGQMMTVKAKPARKVVKARLLKNLKDAV